MTIKILHLDIEGGWGGSSRSLYELVSRLDTNKFSPYVAHKSKGPIVERYSEKNIPTYHIPEIYSYVPRTTNSFKIFIASLPNLVKIFVCIKKIAKIINKNDIDIIHLNYEGLFLVGFLLSKITNIPIIGHTRTYIPQNYFGKIMVRILSSFLENIFFITEMEQGRYKALEGNKKTRGDLLWNICTPKRLATNRPEPRAVFLGNLDPSKGADRIVDIAKELKKIDGQTIFYIFGQDRSGKNYDEKIKLKIKSESLENTVKLMGHTSTPEAEISNSMILIRTSRTNDPWGRDVIEASSSGIPVLATGKYEGVIEDSKNGFLFATFDAAKMARAIYNLENDDIQWRELSLYGIQKGKERFSGKEQVKIFSRVVEGIINGTN